MESDLREAYELNFLPPPPPPPPLLPPLPPPPQTIQGNITSHAPTLLLIVIPEEEGGGGRRNDEGYDKVSESVGVTLISWGRQEYEVKVGSVYFSVWKLLREGV